VTAALVLASLSAQSATSSAAPLGSGSLCFGLIVSSSGPAQVGGSLASLPDSFGSTAREIMLTSSLALSRTRVHNRRHLAPVTVETSEIGQLAERNFREAVDLILQEHTMLAVDLTAARVLNRLLRRDLVPDEIRGRYDHRSPSGYAFEVDGFIGHRPKDFYITWLGSDQARQLQADSPIEFAEIVHNSIAALDSFPDGNGRLSRLMADLILLKAGLAPAFYTSMSDYFARGNPRSGVSREVRKAYFREAVARGQQRAGLVPPPGSQLAPPVSWPWLRTAED
jgi:hypothetical protein